MLIHLAVWDFVIVDRLQLDLVAGTTALTGETGAGKSILIDALELVLGVRTHSNVIRTGCKQAEVIAEFRLNDHSQALRWLHEHELDEPDGGCTLRRIVSRDGRSRAWINARPVSLQLLRSLGEWLVEIYAQNTQQSLRRRDIQRTIVDEYGNHKQLCQRVHDLYDRWENIRSEAQQTTGMLEQRETRLDYLRFQSNELTDAEVAPDTIKQWVVEQRRLAHSETILAALHQAQECLDTESATGAARSLIIEARRHLKAVDGFTADLSESVALLDTILVNLDEIVSTLRHRADNIDLDPEHLAQVELQLARVDDLARKHRVDPLLLGGLQDRIVNEIATLEASDARAIELDRLQTHALAEYQSAATELSVTRQKTGEALATAVTAKIQQLGLDGAVFTVHIDNNPNQTPTANGQDALEFQVCTNAGQHSGPLHRIASGGELSRIALAVHVAGLRQSGAQTLIFDEIDTGIGGRTGEIVGRTLARLGSQRQVLCVTHLPQVAVYADQHLRVLKSPAADQMQVQLETLNPEERIIEIARMLAGEQITDRSIEHAKEMLNRSGH